jgi:flagellar hook-basal body complex protein FliE
MDIRTALAARNYANAREAALPEPNPRRSATDLAGDIAQDFAATMQAADTTAQQTMMGEADPHALVEALAQSQLAVETVVTVRDKVVEAYQEILRMPV